MMIDSSSLLDMNMIRRQSVTQNKLSREIEKNDNDKRLKEACSEFQSIFIKQMLDSMRKTVQKDGILKENQAEKIFEDMLYDEYAMKISKNAGLGLDKLMYRQLSMDYQKYSIE